MIASFLLIVAAQSLPAANPAAAEIETPDPKAMSQADIRSFNAKFDRGHPNYIRCEKRGETGSLIKRLYSCRTNAQWREADDVGNDNARELGDHFRPKFLNQSG